VGSDSSSTGNRTDPSTLLEEWPAVVRCAQCGAFDCQGCATFDAPGRAQSTLAWELLPWELLPLSQTRTRAVLASGSQAGVALVSNVVQGWFLRLWLTARLVSEAPQRMFGQLPDGTLAAAFAFAAVCETLALGSLGLLGLGVCVVALGAEGAWVLVSQWGGTLTGLLAATIGFMLGVHLWAGLCTELGALIGGQGFELRSALRFALYTCGWDFITSPVGFLVATTQLGPRRASALLKAATRALRPAWSAYSTERRGLSTRARRSGAVLSVVSFSALALGAAVASVFWVLQRFG
jgi:hypothetical protein